MYCCETGDVKEEMEGLLERLFYVQNDWDRIVQCGVVEGTSEYITETEVEKAIRQIKSRKVSGPTELVGEMIRAAGQTGVKMTEICNMVVNERKIPRDQELSTLTVYLCIYKEKVIHWSARRPGNKVART